MAEAGAPDLGWSRCRINGCIGVRVSSARCLAHVDQEDLVDFLADLTPGSDLDARGTRFTSDLLGALLAALKDASGVPTVGAVRFGNAQFVGNADFRGVRFQGTAVFDDAKFMAVAVFDDTLFTDEAWFCGAHFGGRASFARARIAGQAHFDRVHFDSHAWFQSAEFMANTWFSGTHFAGACLDENAARRAADFQNTHFKGFIEFHRARFTGDLDFTAAQFDKGIWLRDALIEGDATFADAHFTETERVGPIVVNGNLRLDRTEFDRPVQVEASAATVSLYRATFAADATLRLRHARVLLDGVASSGPLTLTGAPPFRAAGQPHDPLSEDGIPEKADDDSSPRLISLVGVDASQLVLCDVDLSACRFVGSYNLEQLRIEGRCRVRNTPAGWKIQHRWPQLWRWTRRQALVEEHAWRASLQKGAHWPAPEPTYDPPQNPLPPQRLAGMYRQLRKAHEDAKNEPGAADFYYGEMEMRRHDPTTPASERIILSLYWLLSGYGLRASRALAALASLVSATTILLAACGLPGHTPQVWTGSRLNQAAIIALNSIILRGTNEPLTTAGRYIEMVARLTGPVLLGLALLAIRNRVKR